MLLVFSMFTNPDLTLWIRLDSWFTNSDESTGSNPDPARIQHELVRESRPGTNPNPVEARMREFGNEAYSREDIILGILLYMFINRIELGGLCRLCMQISTFDKCDYFPKKVQDCASKRT